MSKMIFNISKYDAPLNIKRAHGFMKFYETDKTEHLFDCISGGAPDKQGKPHPCLPCGLYEVTKPYFIANPAFAGYIRNWFAPLIPQFETKRTELGCHARRSPYTFGCCGVEKGIDKDEALYQLIMGHFETSDEKLWLEVVENIV